MGPWKSMKISFLSFTSAVLVIPLRTVLFIPQLIYSQLKFSAVKSLKVHFSLSCLCAETNLIWTETVAWQLRKRLQSKFHSVRQQQKWRPKCSRVPAALKLWPSSQNAERVWQRQAACWAAGQLAAGETALFGNVLAAWLGTGSAAIWTAAPSTSPTLISSSPSVWLTRPTDWLCARPFDWLADWLTVFPSIRRAPPSVLLTDQTGFCLHQGFITVSAWENRQETNVGTLTHTLNSPDLELFLFPAWTFLFMRLHWSHNEGITLIL